MGINYDKQFYKLENSFDDVHELHQTFCSKPTRENRNLLLLKVAELQHNLSTYKATLKNIYLRDDKLGKNQ